MILYSKIFNYFIAKSYYLLFLHGKTALNLFLCYYPYQFLQDNNIIILCFLDRAPLW